MPRLTQLTNRLKRITSDGRYVVALEPGDKVSVRLYRRRHGFRWSVEDVYRVMARAAADAEIARKRAGRQRK